MDSPRIDFWGYLLISSLILLLAIAGYFSYKSIDWTVLDRIESQTLVLPTPQPATGSAQTATPAQK